MVYKELVELIYEFGEVYKYSVMMSDDDNVLIKSTNFPRVLFDLGYYFSQKGISIETSRVLRSDVSVNGGDIYLKIFKF